MGLVGLVSVFAVAIAGCGGIEAPVAGTIVRPFAPHGMYAGHWGVDFAVLPGTPVRAAAPGTVTFSGLVARNQTITVDHGGAVRSSYSFLATRLAQKGERVSAGRVIGYSGRDHGADVVHFSVRIGGVYVDPTAVACLAAPGPALALDGRTSPPYPSSRAWNPRWHLRSAPHRSSRRRRNCVSAARAGHGPVGARRVTMAEGGAHGDGGFLAMGDDRHGGVGERLLRSGRP